jgi:hypothetical protein
LRTRRVGDYMMLYQMVQGVDIKETKEEKGDSSRLLCRTGVT